MLLSGIAGKSFDEFAGWNSLVDSTCENRAFLERLWS
jgi:hypothetical protein